MDGTDLVLLIYEPPVLINMAASWGYGCSDVYDNENWRSDHISIPVIGITFNSHNSNLYDEWAVTSEQSSHGHSMRGRAGKCAFAVNHKKHSKM